MILRYVHKKSNNKQIINNNNDIHVQDLVFVTLPHGETSVAEIKLHMLTEPPLEGTSGLCAVVALFKPEGNNIWVKSGVDAIIGIESLVASAAWSQHSMVPDKRFVLTPAYVAFRGQLKSYET